jgi:hypothetical protein
MSVDNEAARWPASPQMAPVAVVVLEHTEHAVDTHWDLLIARGPDPAGLWGARCARRPDTAPPGAAMPLERTEDHSRAWLSREGSVSGGRGVATRCVAGLLRVDLEGRAVVRWDDGRTARWTLRGDAASPTLMVDELTP